MLQWRYKQTNRPPQSKTKGKREKGEEGKIKEKEEEARGGEEGKYR